MYIWNQIGNDNSIISSNPPTWPHQLLVCMSPGGGTRVHHGRVGSAGLLWPQNSTSVAETEKGGQNSTMTPPPTLEKGVNILHQNEKSAKKGGQKSTILKNIGVKILQVPPPPPRGMSLRKSFLITSPKSSEGKNKREREKKKKGGGGGGGAKRRTYMCVYFH